MFSIVLTYRTRPPDRLYIRKSPDLILLHALRRYRLASYAPCRIDIRVFGPEPLHWFYDRTNTPTSHPNSTPTLPRPSHPPPHPRPEPEPGPGSRL